jgi:hypothetical protein
VGKTGSAVTRRPLSELLRLPVRTGDIELGRPVDAFLADDGRVVGFEVLGRDGLRRFLPLAATTIRDGELSVSSALVFLEDRSLAYYRERTRSARALGLQDVWVEEDGTVGPALSVG